MRPEIEERLLGINKLFYSEFAEQFAQTRGTPQPGFSMLLDYLPQPCHTVVDIGCGNGRFGLFLASYSSDFAYTGVDFTEPFLQLAGNSLAGEYIARDISRPGFLEGRGKYDLTVCLATLQHIPGKENRFSVLKEMVDHLADHGRIFLSNWQFVQSDRQRRKILDWQEVGLHADDVDANDYLLSWQRNSRGRRYVHLVDQSELAWLAARASLTIFDEFYSDGKEGNLNLYTILGKPDVDTK
ncbi:MAG: class I SAM-dependent methyltransferase [Candidatus Promineifilaceae bacterium]|jgi:tRNA (uracil-5-)-methyltransferase TRM9